MDKVKVIGFSGLAGSGKDTCAKLVSEIVPNCKRMSFADSVKDVASILFGWDRSMLTGDTKESRQFREQKDEFWSNVLGRDFTPRLALQLIGTECFRNTIDNNFWVYVIQNKILRENSKDTVYLIPDVRFPNEIKMIHEIGGFVLRVSRGNLPDWGVDAINYNKQILIDETTKMPESLKKVHISERALLGLNLEDFLIFNNGSFDELRDNLKETLNKLGL